jgi:UDP-N-acetylmuramoyl-L-alanyl-D-glutamate--2,6-diaminopimelate ligase
MTLGQLLAGCAEVAPEVAGVALGGLTADSRRVAPGDLFVALPKWPRAGFKFDGHDFVSAAVAAGAVAVVAQEPVAATVPVVRAPDTRRLLPRLAARWFGAPSEKLRLVGVTGTNGKTTITYLLEAIWRAAGQPCVVVGTIETRLGDERRPAVTTTPDPLTLQALWRECADRGLRFGAMEVSSHALDQHRVDATRYEVAVFTNLTQDHLDYHGDMESYFAAKAKLFEPDDEGRQPKAVVNADDAYGVRLLAGGLPAALSFGFGPTAEVRAEAVVCGATGSSFQCLTPAGAWRQELATVGRYNVANALAAIGAALALGIAPAAIAEGLAGCAGAPGRLERVDAGQPFGVLVDYAHTPDALQKAIAAVRPLARRVITVFGCGGDRDRTKRPLMGALAAAGSDLAVVTSDNPRSEAPEAIVADITAGIGGELGAKVAVEVDRRAAIGLAIAAAQPGDIVLIAGKGHEDYQLVAGEKHHFDDREVARDCLAGRV